MTNWNTCCPLFACPLFYLNIFLFSGIYNFWFLKKCRGILLMVPITVWWPFSDAQDPKYKRCKKGTCDNNHDESIKYSLISIIRQLGDLKDGREHTVWLLYLVVVDCIVLVAWTMNRCVSFINFPQDCFTCTGSNRLIQEWSIYAFGKPIQSNVRRLLSVHDITSPFILSLTQITVLYLSILAFQLAYIKK